MDTPINDLNPDISIIVPVYNVEKYLIRCLDSIFNQEFSGSFEVIAVEDASTNNSLELLKKYQENEVRLKIIEHSVNKKLSVARATGVIASSGDYIMHIDQDDWLLPNALENLYSKCLETEADILVYNYIQEDSDGKRKFVNNIKKQIITTDKVKVQHLFFGATWSKIMKRSIAKDLLSGQVGVNNTEDLIYGIEILSKAERICLLPEYYYTYFVNVNSMTHLTKVEQYIESQFIILDQIQNIIDKYEVNSVLSINILNYFEKWIYLEFAKLHANHIENVDICNNLIKEFSKFPIMNQTRINHLELSLNNKFRCYKEVLKRFGLRMTLSVILIDFKKQTNL